MFQAAAAVRALQVPPELAARLTLPLPLEFVASSLWALVFAWLTLHLLRLKPRARTFMNRALAGFVTYSLLRLLLFAQADYDQQRLPFLLILTAITAAGWAILQRFTGDTTDDGHQSSQR